MHKQWDRIAHMNRAKARLAATGGTMQRARSRAPDAVAGSWDRLLTVTRAKWDCWAGDAIEGYRFAVFGDQWEGF